MGNYPSASQPRGKPSTDSDWPRIPRSESVLTVSWDDEFGRLNLIVLALALVAVAGHYAPPWFGL